MSNISISAGTLVGGTSTPIQYPFINGFRPSWASIEFRVAINGGAPQQPIIGMQSIQYKLNRERRKTRGTNVNPLGKTRGQCDYTCKIKLLLAESDQLLAALAAQDLTGNNAFGDVQFIMTVQYAETNMAIITDIIEGCTIDSVDQDSAEGVDDIMVEHELNPIRILRNGRPMSSQPLGAAQP